jgi:hypothetical protein
MLFLLLSACAHMNATWEITPATRVGVSEASMAIVADNEQCRHIADALAQEIDRREGVQVSPNASVRLALSHCQVRMRSEVDITQLYPGLDGGLTGGSEQRDEVIRAIGSVALTVEVDGRPQATLGAKSHRVSRVQGKNGAKSRLGLLSGVARDLAVELAQQIAPEPEQVRRRLYRNPEPGSAEALHNQAVEAERNGDLSRALELAKRAAGAAPGRAHHAYVQTLEARVSGRRYVESDW